MDDNKKPMIVPFGKYKGKPIEALQEDDSYIQWLTAQSWFKEKYQNFYTVIVNNFQAPTETPEHNQMQVKFLAEEYRLKVAYKLIGEKLFKYNQAHFDETIPDLFSQIDSTYRQGSIKEKIVDLDGTDLLIMSKVGFEQSGVDVDYYVSYGYGDYY